MTHTNIYRSIVGIGALALMGGFAGAASANTYESAAPYSTPNVVINQAQSQANKEAMATCSQLPQSQKEMCAQRAGYGTPTVDELRTPAQQAAIDRENEVYQKATAVCRKNTLSRRTTCTSEAGRDWALEAAASR